MQILFQMVTDFSKYILDYSFNPSSKYPRYCLCWSPTQLMARWSLIFVAFGFFFF